MTTKTPFDQFVLVNIELSAYSGLAALPENCLKEDYEKKIVSSGNMEVVPAEELKIFATLRARARNSCLSVGTSFCGGYAVPTPKWVELQENLNTIMADFESYADHFIASYPHLVENQASAWPTNANIIRSIAQNPEWIATRFSANYSAAFLQPAPGMEDALVKQVQGMEETLLSEIALDAKAAIRAHNKGSKITRKMKSTLYSMLDKLRGLAFLGDQTEGLAITLQAQLDVLEVPFSQSGPLSTETQSQIATLLIAMSDPDNLRDLSAVLKIQHSKQTQYRTCVPASSIHHPIKQQDTEVLFFL
jgi:hypothetical protein